ncbi:MAG: lipopolysaccharide biosynthesis protein [Acidobacteriota bacterium]|nr:lipopolysaccharide biosynthesis protein [Acidobacteriota bacterium]
MPTATKANQYLGTADLKVDLGLRTARGGAVTVGSQGVKFFLSMFATVILARLLTPRDYGLVGMVAVVTGFISIFKDLGLSSATIQRADLNEGQVSTLFWVNISFSVLIMFVTVAISPLVARFYGEPRLGPITIAYSAGFLLGGLTVQHEALLRRRMRFGGLAAAEIFALLVGLSTGIYLAWRGKNYWALVFSQLSQGLAYAVAVWLICRWHPGLPVRNSGVRSLLAFGRNLTGFSIINYFARNLDNLLIGRFWGGLELGLYARAYQLLMLPIEQISAPITSVAIPALSRLTDSPERYRNAYVRLIEKIAILTMPLMVFMIATSDWVVLLLLGPKWTGVSRIFALLAIAGFIQPVSGTAGWLYVTQGRTRQMFQWGLIGSSIIIVSIVAGLPWGAVGVAASYSITFILVVTPLSIWFVAREGPVRARDFYRAIAPPACASISALAALVAFRQWSSLSQPLLRLALAFAIATVVTVVVLVLIPAGRRLLRDLKGFAILLLRREEITTAI